MTPDVLIAQPKIAFKGPEDAPILLLAHGAGAPMDSPFMNEISTLLVTQAIRIARFEFPYMAMRRIDGKKRPPDRVPKCLETFRHALAALPGAATIFIGGKSMGGRMATLLATEKGLNIKGVIVFGYPFHPPGKPDNMRTDHFPDIQYPTLICQGERDAFGNKPKISALTLPETIQVQWLPDGNHNLAPRKKSGYTARSNTEAAAKTAAKFIYTYKN